VPIWPSDLKLLPNIEQCDILFIKKKCDWNDDMIASNCTKKDNGNALFTSHASFHQIVKMERPIKHSKDWCCGPRCKSDGRKRGK
jgi:hypothetical protein